MSELFTGPRHFREVTFHRHTDRTIGWLELFYDLVYVATLIQVGNFLSDNLELAGFGQFLIMMFVVWWAWSGETLYQNRYVVDDIWHRLLVFIQILGIATIGLSVSDAFGGLAAQFTLGYVLARSMLIVMYARVYVSQPDSRDFAVRYMIGFAGGIAIWLVALLLPQDVRWIAWLIAIAFEIFFFTRHAMLRMLFDAGLDHHHLVERQGIFTIIVLGEAFVKVLDDAQGTLLGIEQIAFGVVAVGVLCALWWLYFSDTAGKLYDTGSNLKGTAYSYGHLVLPVSLVTFGVAIKKLFAETVNYAGTPITEEYRFALTAAITMFLLAMALVDYGLDDTLTPHSQMKRVLAYLVSAVVVVVLGTLLTDVTATQYTGIIGVIVVALVGLSIYRTVTTPEPEPAHEPHAE